MKLATDHHITDQATAKAALHAVRDGLREATKRQDTTAARLKDLILTNRTAGVLTVNEMSESIGESRGYVDSLWSTRGDTRQGRQTRVQVQATEAQREAAVRTLADASAAARRSRSEVDAARAERNRVVAMVYAAKILGPAEISHEVGIDRNHVLRICRKAGVAPAWRKDARNQYTTGK